MATIDLIVLGMLRKEELSAYDIQKLVEYRKISQWVKISTPSIYKKVIQLEEKGYLTGKARKEGKLAEKKIYTLTQEGVKEFEKLMLEISEKPLNMYLDFNAVVVNLMNLPKKQQKICIGNIEENIKATKKMVEENIQSKEKLTEIPKLGKAVLYQQYALADALDQWIQSLKE
ncbi:MAG: PadR family transcriptional regulator [Anaerostipes sp.]|jgi:DNA-binding PadR family transcriptional regulator|nr:PadR family transcriptional regulator [Anaerostipes sp.]